MNAHGNSCSACECLKPDIPRSKKRSISEFARVGERKLRFTPRFESIGMSQRVNGGGKFQDQHFYCQHYLYFLCIHTEVFNV